MSDKDLNMVLPTPPPLLHTRSGNDYYDRPQTPTQAMSNQQAFTSPVQTPQGSPSKKQFPPGANDLPNVFDNAMKLAPMSPTKQQPNSPAKGQDPFTDPNSSYLPRSESPTRSSNKENAPTSPTKFGKDNFAAQSRHDQYHKSERAIIKGLTTEELQKTQLPKIKRLANVTQLCRWHQISPSTLTDSYRLS